MNWKHINKALLLFRHVRMEAGNEARPGGTDENEYIRDKKWKFKLKNTSQ